MDHGPRADQRLRIAPLARELGWERSRVSLQARRMTQRGLTTTKPVTDDERGTEEMATTAEGSFWQIKTPALFVHDGDLIGIGPAPVSAETLRPRDISESEDSRS
jgi:hypothetical protein